MLEPITVAVRVSAPLQEAWRMFTDPDAIVAWNSPSDDWHTTKAHTDLRSGGAFTYRMEARDGSAGFDFSGTYTEVRPNEYLAYTMEDGRKAAVSFQEEAGTVRVTEVFDPETENSRELQQAGWQAILERFKSFVEAA